MDIIEKLKESVLEGVQMLKDIDEHGYCIKFIEESHKNLIKSGFSESDYQKLEFLMNSDIIAFGEATILRNKYITLVLFFEETFEILKQRKDWTDSVVLEVARRAIIDHNLFLDFDANAIFGEIRVPT